MKTGSRFSNQLATLAELRVAGVAVDDLLQRRAAQEPVEVVHEQAGDDLVTLGGRTADMPGGPMPPSAGAKGAAPKDKHAKPRQGPRNLVYTLRYALPQPAKTVAVSAIDPEDFVRIELDKKTPWEIVGGNATCAVDKNNAAKSEYWPGNPFFADRVTCKLP